MATTLHNPESAEPTSAQPAPPVQAAEFEAAISARLKQTVRRLKTLDLFASLLTWAAAVMTLLVLALVADHWLFNLGAAGRWLAFALIAGLTGWFAVRRWAPLLLRSINPIYAAKSIEEGSPRMKNSLVNYLYLRDRPADSRQAVLDALARRAVGDLRQTDDELTVDGSHVVRAAAVVVAALAVICFYSVLTPKSAWTSTQRVLAPWSDKARPTRVRFEQVAPGDARVLQGRQVELRCEVRGLRGDEAPMVYYSSTDGVVADQSEAMRQLDGQWMLPFPPDGADRHLSYRIAVGDGSTPTYQLTVVPVPTVTVERVEYFPPAYTGQRPTTEPGGTIRAVEGADVAIHGLASDLVQSAKIVLHRADGSGEDPVAMAVVGERSMQQRLTMKLQDGKPVYNRYHLAYTTPDGHASESPVAYAIEVAPDLPPAVEWVAPTADVIDLPRDQTLKVVVRAQDPDYGLRQIQLIGHVGRELVLEHVREFPQDEPARGRVSETVVIDPPRLGLRVGDEVLCHAAAVDNYGENQDGAPQRSRSRDVRIRILPPREASADDADPQAPDPAAQPPSNNGGDAANDDGGSDGGGSDGDGTSSSADGPADGEEGGGSGEAAGDMPSDSEGSSTDTSESGEAGEAGEATDGEGGGTNGASGGSQDGSSGGAASGAAAGGSADGSNGRGASPADASTGAGDLGGRSDPTGEGAAGDGGPGTASSGGPDQAATPGAAPDVAGQPTAGANDDGARVADGEPSGQGEPLHDGEVIERLAEELQRRAERLRGGASDDAGAAAANPPRDLSPDRGNDSANAGDGAAGAADPRSQADPGAAGVSGEVSDRAEVDAAGAGDRPAKRDDPTNAAQPSAGAPGAGSDSRPNDPPQPSSKGPAKGDQGDSQAPPGTQGDGTASESGSTGGQPDPDSPTAGPSGPSDPSKLGAATGTGERRDGESQGPPAGGGAERRSDSEQTRRAAAPSPRDRANLQYAQMATDMVLEYLDDQEAAPDPRLLEELGWTDAELQAFLERWRAMKRAAAQSEQGRERLEDALRGLGLRDPEITRRTESGPDDEIQHGDAGAARTPPPSRYRDKFRAFRQRLR